MANEKPKLRPFQFVLKYISEIVVIFLGITISFMFDQWNRNRDQAEKEIAYTQSLLTDISLKKEELESDNPNVIVWINRLDSINKGRLSGQVSDHQLTWFYRILTTGDLFFFSPSTPSFNTSLATGLWQDLPDSVRREIYTLYNVDFIYNEVVYRELSKTISNFRNTVLVPDGNLVSNDTNQIPDYEKVSFSLEIRKPSYKNIINNIVIQEKELYRLNLLTIHRLDEVSSMLRNYLMARKSK